MDVNSAQNLIEAIKGLNNPWVDMASLIAVLISLIALGITTSDFFNRKKPHLEIVFAAPNAVACLTLKNSGEVPLVIKSLTINNDFVDSLPETGNKERLKGKLLCDVVLLPNECQYFNLGAIAYTLMNDRNIRDLVINCTFSRVGARRKYKVKNKKLDFHGYANFLVETDIIEQLKQINKTLKEVDKNIKQLQEKK